jgi:cytochrome c oxidase subunit III
LADTIIVASPHGSADTTHVRHHFATAAQQYEAASLGMWTFLITEVLFFGGLFTSYAIYRSLYPDAFASTSAYMNVVLGGINTIILATSTLTMAMAVRSAQLSRTRSLVNYLSVTFLLGTVFLLIKGYEYYSKWSEHLIPGTGFQYANSQLEHHVQIFFFLYFAMTGMHALHMIVGMGLLVMLLVKAARGAFNSEYFTPVRMIGLYWEFVDIIWIFLFPLLYVIGARS